MPFYDRICHCGWTAIDVLEAIETVHACPDCGMQTERAWLTKPSNVIGDECDFVSHNGEKQPVRFRSKAEHKRWLKERGWRIKDDHVGEQGTDKSRFTSRWAGGGKQWLADAEALAQRHGASVGKDPGDEPVHVTFTTGDLTDLPAYLSKR